MEEDGGMHLYAFCSGNPVNEVDALGALSLDLKDPEIVYEQTTKSGVY